MIEVFNQPENSKYHNTEKLEHDESLASQTILGLSLNVDEIPG